ncbi:MAG TPA: OmpH family outer membrane protein [Abditibacteriaceae bacterium]|jgi:Skp family chaperone for outer membrane proteins
MKLRAQKLNGLLTGKVLGALMLGFVAVSPLVVSPAQAQAVTVGTLDEDELADKYTSYKSALDAIEGRAKGIDRQLEARELLSPEEGKQFDALIVKSPRVAADEGALNGLVKAGTDRRAEYLALIAKSNRTADEETKIKQFLGYSQGNDADLRTLSNKLFGAIKAEQEEAEKKFTDNANSIIADVAKKKGLKLVVRKRALVWSDDAVDITKDVLAQLNK